MISFFDLSDLQRFVAVWEDIQQSSVGNKVEARKGFLLLLQVIIPTKNSTMRTTGLTVTLCFTVIAICCIKIASLRTWQWSFAGVQGICDVSPWLLFQDRQQNHNRKKKRCNSMQLVFRKLLLPRLRVPAEFVLGLLRCKCPRSMTTWRPRSTKTSKDMSKSEKTDTFFSKKTSHRVIMSAPPSSNPAHIVVLRFFKILRDQAARSHIDLYWSHSNQSHKTAETCHGVAIRIYVTLVFNCF